MAEDNQRNPAVEKSVLKDYWPLLLFWPLILAEILILVTVLDYLARRIFILVF